MNKKYIIILVSIIIIILIVAGAYAFYYRQNLVDKGQNPDDGTQLANPASVNCVRLGGKVEIRTDVQGGQTGFCKFENGQECEEWALFRNECALSPSSQTATLEGRVTVGPICPVERLDSPCPVPVQTYTSREVIIYKTDGKTVAARQKFSAQGTYLFEMAPGTYVVSLPQTGGLGFSKDLPQTVILEAGKTQALNFSIDTGMR